MRPIHCVCCGARQAQNILWIIKIWSRASRVFGHHEDSRQERDRQQPTLRPPQHRTQPYFRFVIHHRTTKASLQEPTTRPKNEQSRMKYSRATRRGPQPSKYKNGQRKTLLAVLVVAVVGVLFFLGRGNGPSLSLPDYSLLASSSVTTTSSETSSAKVSEQEVSKDVAESLLDLPKSTKEVVINVGSNIDPIMPSPEMGPCAHAIAVEPLLFVASDIPKHRQLSVIVAAIAEKPGVRSMRINNMRGMSSSLAEAASVDKRWNSNPKRGDGALAIVPVITLSALLNSIPKTTKVSFIKTDMQGFDFAAIKAAGPVLKERVTHMLNEVWYDDTYSYYAENDLCRDWLPFMTELGYTLVKSYDGEKTVEEIKAGCEKQLKDKPERPSVKENYGLKETDAYWVRNDAIGQPMPNCNKVQKFKPGFTDADYAKCI